MIHTNPFQLLLETLNVTSPVFVMVALGVLFRKLGWMNEVFVKSASNLVFRATMPTLFFLSVWKSDIRHSVDFGLLGMFGSATLLLFFGSWMIAHFTVTRSDRGVFVQGAFRGNCGVLSFALAASTYGVYGSSVGGVLAGFSVFIFNVFSVWVLAVYSSKTRLSFRTVMREVCTNPLLLAVVSGALASYFGITAPLWVNQSAQYLASITLPLALLCVGASLSVISVQQSGWAALHSSLLKVVVLPVAGCMAAWGLGFSGRDLIILWLFWASPTAAGSFPMAMAVGNDGRMAASIIAISTGLSLFTLTTGLYILKALGN